MCQWIHQLSLPSLKKMKKEHLYLQHQQMIMNLTCTVDISLSSAKWCPFGDPVPGVFCGLQLSPIMFLPCLSCVDWVKLWELLLVVLELFLKQFCVSDLFYNLIRTMIDSVTIVNSTATPNSCIINYAYRTYDTLEVCWKRKSCALIIKLGAGWGDGYVN